MPSTPQGQRNFMGEAGWLMGKKSYDGQGEELEEEHRQADILVHVDIVLAC